MAAIYSKGVLSGRELTSVGPFCDCTHPDRWHLGSCKVEGCGCTMFVGEMSTLTPTHVHRARLVRTKKLTVKLTERRDVDMIDAFSYAMAAMAPP